jgi:hypothetical protein
MTSRTPSAMINISRATSPRRQIMSPGVKMDARIFRTRSCRNSGWHSWNIDTCEFNNDLNQFKSIPSSSYLLEGGQIDVQGQLRFQLIGQDPECWTGISSSLNPPSIWAKKKKNFIHFGYDRGPWKINEQRSVPSRDVQSIDLSTYAASSIGGGCPTQFSPTDLCQRVSPRRLPQRNIWSKGRKHVHSLEVKGVGGELVR